MIAGILFGFLPLAIWLYLLLFHLNDKRNIQVLDLPGSNSDGR